MHDDRKLVYSSEHGFREQPKASGPKQRSGKPSMPDDGIVRVARERRRASVVTLVHGLRPDEVLGIAKTLKRLCGTGGTSKNGTVEIQGDHRERIMAWFAEQGRKAKIAGG